MITKFLAWLTAPRRKAIYGVVAAGIAALMAFNIITADQVNTATNSVTQLIMALTAAMAYFHTDTQDTSETYDEPVD